MSFPPFFFGKHCFQSNTESKQWLQDTANFIFTLSLRRGQRVLDRAFSQKVREIRTRFSTFYAPYAKRFSWLDTLKARPAAPETLLLPTRWLLKKHAAVSAEFRALETSIARVSWDEIAPAHLLETSLLLNDYVEKTAFRFSEETLASTLNDWQESRGVALSLAETEALSSILRLLALDKLSLVARSLKEAEQARTEARKFFEAFGPDQARFNAARLRTEKKRGTDFARVFAETFSESLIKEVGPISRFRERANEINTPTISESKSVLATRVRILLRSLSLLGEFEWGALLKKTNALHRFLVRDPADIYTQMTSLSQEMYRRKAAALAKVLRISEETLAKTILELTEASEMSPGNHMGYYLIDNGLPTLLKRLTGRDTLSWWYWYHDRKKLPLLQRIYFGLIVVGSGILFSVITFLFHTWFLAIIALPILYRLTKHLIDSLFTSVVPATLLPKLNFRRNIPDTASAVFVIPALLKDAKTLRTLIGKLETAYLSNTTGAVSFCLLLDFPDAKRETLPEDAELLETTRETFRALNARYGEEHRFWFVLRSRVWSAPQERWMGWERKRGKLLEFARLLRDRPTLSPFIVSREILPRADFVVTLDEDAFIPRDFIKDILGVHAHPLQRPILSDSRLTSGYTFIQPHVKQWFKNRHRFRLPRIFFDEKRFSIYSSAFSELYQDVFSEGSYAGKGSFHIDSFLAALDKTLPTDQILSHDLLEGSLARTAYAADVEAFDEFPKSLRAFLARSHRWTRGDWQIIDWLFPTVRDEGGTTRKNTLANIHRFKIADNLIQSLFRPAVFALTILSWILGKSDFLLFVWGLFLTELFLLDAIIDWTRWTMQLVRRQWKHLRFRLMKTLVRSARLIRQTLFECALLPYTALDTLHAITTALFRRLFSKKHMLEWVPSAHFENPAGREPMIFPLLTILVVAISFRFDSPMPPFFAFLLIIWTGIPLFVFVLNRPYTEKSALPKSARENLRRNALETWSFFARAVRPETNFLPPDYIRFNPAPQTASYTSITNIGFFLTSILTAHRFGFISRYDARARLSTTIQTLERLETYRGHFYNWYDVRTALPAPPLFISSVDSGNLLSALLALRQWLPQSYAPELPIDILPGLRDMARLIRDRIPRTLDFQSSLDAWEAVVERIEEIPLNQDIETFRERCRSIEASLPDNNFPSSLPNEARDIFILLRKRIADIANETERDATASSPDLEKHLDAIIAAMRFDFLKSGKRGLISIGFHVPSKRLENRFYQTLASEARLTNFLALAEGTLSFRGWNKLNRTVLALPEGPSLISWTGTLFEYLMPALFLEEHRDSLVGRSIQTAIRMNRRYAKKRHLPVWGLSESGYAELDRGGSYRYKPFGLPSLSLAPSADDRPVISAYVSAMSLPFFPKASCANLNAYAARGGYSPLGFIEAIDFHRSRHGSPVRMCMSHHQGMILSALGNYFFDHFLARLFESHPLIQNSLFVLDEGLPPIDKEPFPRPATPYLRSALIHPRTP
jgi:cyclic beta-1,2-glucan synthetase